MNRTPPLKPSVLIVDDDQNARTSLCGLLKQEGFHVIDAGAAETGLRLLRQYKPDVVLFGLRQGAAAALANAKQIDAAIPMIELAEGGGANPPADAEHDCRRLAKRCRRQDLIGALRIALAGRSNGRPPEENRPPRLAASDPLQEKMGSSDEVRRLIADIDRVAPTDFTVIISGETGSGKELAAREIHRRSRRANGAFVAIDCGAVQPSLIESELFGHEKGAFTGADRSREGKFLAASGGTVFLDEIQNLPLGVQTKVLRVMQERQACPLGGSRYVNFDVRVIAATNQNLPAMAAAGRFRQDLYHRLNEFSIEIAPLRQRADDILYLAERFMRQTCEELSKSPQTISADALEALERYSWPGNVRELRNLIRRAVLLADAEIGLEHLGPIGQSSALERQTASPERSAEPVALKTLVRRKVVEAEREILTRVLRQTGGNKAEAARLLQIDYKTLRTKARQYGITFLLKGKEEAPA